MTILFLAITVLSFVLPQDSLLLPNACATIELSNTGLYGAPFVGNVVYRIPFKGIWNTITFSDNVPVRIVGFKVTPFALFINDGTRIARYFLNTMDRTVITRADDVSAFAITRSEEIIYSNQRLRTVHFLDYTGQEKNRLEDLSVRDLKVVDTLIYVLTNTLVAICDEFGTMRTQHLHKGSFNGMHVQDGRVYLFARGQQQLYVITDDQITSYDLPFRFQDITGSDSLIYVLNERGTVLYRYHSTAF